MDTSLAIIILVGVIYALIMIGVVMFIIYKRRGTFNHSIDQKPPQTFKANEELEDK